MEDFNAFMDFSKKPKKKCLEGGSTVAQMVDNPQKWGAHGSEPNLKRKLPKRFAKAYVRRFKDDVFERFAERNAKSYENIVAKDDLKVYDKYNFDYHRENLKLPIQDYHQEILETVEKHPVTVVHGATGCGKTTQLPQYILDDARAKGKYCNIVVAQPRRIAAKSNASRVCQERGWKCGTVVGYQIGSDHLANCSRDTRLLYCTTGVLVEKLINNESLDPYTHIILDEIHERNMDMDFLMIIVYKHMKPGVKVIMMSATIEEEKFAKYFEIPSGRSLSFQLEAPIIKIRGQNRFEIKKYYLDDLQQCFGDGDVRIQQNIEHPNIPDVMYTWVLRLILLFERQDMLEMEADGISQEDRKKLPRPTVLIFLPGISEIKEMYHALERLVYLSRVKLVRICLHSTIDPCQNVLAMAKTPPGVCMRKIILATNIAESSITVPDVKYVIDFCMSKTLVTDPQTKFRALRLGWASHENCEQRAGRTGRVMDGHCFRMVKQLFYERSMKAAAQPEMVTSPLDNVVLKAKHLKFGTPKEILALAMNPPKLDNIEQSIVRLKEMGALLRTKDGEFLDRDGDLTFVGRMMSRLPIDLRSSKLIILGYCFGILDECVTIAAAMNCRRSLFEMDTTGGMKQYTKQLEWADGSGSDLFAMLNAYRTWRSKRDDGDFGSDKTHEERKRLEEKEKAWTKKHALDRKSLHECAAYIEDIYIRLNRMGLLTKDQKNNWSKNEKYIVLKVAIAGAFYPHYYVRSTKTKRQCETTIAEILTERDPCDTVYFTGFDKDDCRHIYIDRVKELFIKHKVVDPNERHKLKVTFDGAGQKVFVTFKKSGKEDDQKQFGVACQPGFVLTEVYKSIKMRRLMSTHKVPVFGNRAVSLGYAKEHDLHIDANFQVRIDGIHYEDTCLPRIYDTAICGAITHTENCGRFWFQPARARRRVFEYDTELNNDNNDLEPFNSDSDVSIGQVLAAPFSDDERPEYYRAKVIGKTFHSINGERQVLFEVRFIDFGNTHSLAFSDLRRLSGVSAAFISEPPRCFECALANVQPSQINSPDGIWSPNAKSIFTKTDQDNITIEIYSVVGGIARVFIKMANGQNINNLLKREQVAEYTQESYMSRQDNIERCRAQKLGATRNNYIPQCLMNYFRDEAVPVIPPPPDDVCNTSVTLVGPHSPLEIRPYGITKLALTKDIRIDLLSVNNVLLENQPNDSFDKYLVSVTSCRAGKDSEISIRQTTLMPHIRVFTPLMAAIFAQCVQLEKNPAGTHYSLMMTGLGYDSNGKPIAEDNDMLFELDAEITNEDMLLVNKIRAGMNKLLGLVERRPLYSKGKATIIERLKTYLIDLLSETRLALPDPEVFSVKWEEYHPEMVLKDKNESRNYPKDIGEILQPHKLLKLNRPMLVDLIRMKQNDTTLKDRAKTDVEIRSAECLVCNKRLDDPNRNLTILRHHLISRQHIERVKVIEQAIEKLNK